MKTSTILCFLFVLSCTSTNTGSELDGGGNDIDGGSELDGGGGDLCEDVNCGPGTCSVTGVVAECTCPAETHVSTGTGCAVIGEPICQATGTSTCFYVQPNGSDENDGSITSPFRTFYPALTQAGPGDFIYARAGTFDENHTMNAGVQRLRWIDSAEDCGPGQLWLEDEGSCFLDRSNILYMGEVSGWATTHEAFSVADGEEGAEITVKAYPGEHVILNATDLPQVFDPRPGSETSWPDIKHAIGVYRSYWRIEGFEIIGGAINTGGGGVDYQVHDITILNNDIHHLRADGGNNPGIIRIDRGDIGGPYNIFILNNRLHDFYDDDYPEQVFGVPDSQHFGAVTTLSRQVYLGFEGGGTGRIDIIGNEIFNVPQVFFFKNPADGPINIRDNYIHDSGSLADWASSNLTLENNKIVNVERGVRRVGSPQDFFDDPDMFSISGQNINVSNNTFIGPSNLYSLTTGVVNSTQNIFVNMFSDIDDANYNGDYYYSSGMRETTDTSVSHLQNSTSDNNCFIHPSANLLMVTRYLDPLEFSTPAQALTRFGFDGNSTFIVNQDAESLFDSSYNLIDSTPCPTMGSSLELP